MRRWRTFLAGLMLTGWIVAYAVLATTLANQLFDHESSLILQTLYYLVAGFAWIPLCVPILRFAKRDPKRIGPHAL